MAGHVEGEEESRLLSEAQSLERWHTATFGLESNLVIDPEPVQKPHGPPLWTWALLVAAVTSVSSAGVVFALMPEVPTFTLAAWRLQLTSVFLGLAGGYQFWAQSGEDRRRTLQNAWLMGLSGGALAVHFGAWVYSVQHTSLSHSLLFVSATPLILAGGAWLLRKPISRGELAGTAVGVVGAVLLATAAAKADQTVTLAGDMAALLGSFAFVGYLLIGQNLRKWMPIFIYAFAVTGLAASLLTVTAIAVEGARPGAAGAGGAFGWVADTRYLPKILYLAVVPGILGHQGFNTLLRYMAPLIITLGCNMEPLIGSLLGWVAGVMAAPGAWTYVGGALVMVSTVAVTLAAHCREKEAAAAAAKYANLALAEVLTGGGATPAALSPVGAGMGAASFEGMPGSQAAQQELVSGKAGTRQEATTPLPPLREAQGGTAGRQERPGSAKRRIEFG